MLGQLTTGTVVLGQLATWTVVQGQLATGTVVNVMFALMREYISIYFYTVMVTWRLILTWYYINGDNFRLHIFLMEEKTD